MVRRASEVDTLSLHDALPILSVTTAATAGSAVGTYPITASGQTSGNYTISYVAGTLTVTNAIRTRTVAEDPTCALPIFPALTVSYAGFVNGDSSLSLGGALSVTTTATAGSAVRSEERRVGEERRGKCTISYVAGTLTVTKAKLTGTADDKTKSYGDGNRA